MPLEEFDNNQLEIDIGEEIHHLISVGPYAFTLRINRLGNYFGIDINSTDNLISAPSVDPVAFKKKHGMAFSDLSDKSKYDIAAAAIEKVKSSIIREIMIMNLKREFPVTKKTGTGFS